MIVLWELPKQIIGKLCQVFIHHQSELNTLNGKEIITTLFEHVVADVIHIFAVEPHLHFDNNID